MNPPRLRHKLGRWILACLAGALFSFPQATGPTARAADAEPHTKTKVCGGDEVYCADVTSSNRVKVDAQFSSVTTTVPSWSKFLRYVDMNVAGGGVARGTNITTSATWTTVFSYSGSGFLAGALINLDTFAGWEIRLLVDGQTLFSFVSEDLTTDTLYDVDDITDVNQMYLGVSKGSHDRFVFHAPMTSPIYYATSVVFQVRRPTAGAKKFQAGLVVLSKES